MENGLINNSNSRSIRTRALFIFALISCTQALRRCFLFEVFSWIYLIAILCWIIFWWHHKTSAFSCTSINRLYNVNHFLFVFQGPVDFVVVTRAQINHDVFVAEEEHAGARVVQLVPEDENIRMMEIQEESADTYILLKSGTAVMSTWRNKGRNMSWTRPSILNFIQLTK